MRSSGVGCGSIERASRLVYRSARGDAVQNGTFPWCVNVLPAYLYMYVLYVAHMQWCCGTVASSRVETPLY